MQFETYIFVGPDYLAYYVGEGSRRRFLDTHRVTVPPEDRILHFPHSSKHAAQEHEKFLIKQFGRLDQETGLLQNRTCGGPGTSEPGPYQLEVMREHGRLFGPTAGRKAAENGNLSCQTTEQLSANCKRRNEIHGVPRNPGLVKGCPSPRGTGWHHTQETKDKMRTSGKNRKQDLNGSNNPMFGEKHSEATKQKIRDKRLAYFASLKEVAPHVVQ